MNIEELRDYALSLPETEECMPFGESTLVFKVQNKIFLLTSLDAEELSFNVKCDPEEALEWREKYDSIVPGYHMNKKHWNTVFVRGDLGQDQLKEFIKKSYDLVNKKKKK